jgi:magnesium chelatase family protein
MNLCPCGARGDPAAACSCSPQRLASYRDKLSHALLDRIDLIVQVPRARARDLAEPPAEPSGVVGRRVTLGRRRLDGEAPAFSRDAAALLDRAVDSLPLSARGRAKVARVATTIAALAAAPEVACEHVAEALSYRAPADLAAWS